MYRRSEVKIVLLVWLAMIATSQPATGQSKTEQALLAASSDTQLWFITGSTQKGDGYQLFHHAQILQGPYFQRFQKLPEVPVMVGSWDDHLWLVFHHRASSGREIRREVYVIQARMNDSVGIYEQSPPDHLTKVHSLPSEGRLADFIGTPRGPMALLLPYQRAGVKIEAGPSSLASSPTLQAPSLLQLRGNEWVEIDLPNEFDMEKKSFLLSGDRDGKSLVLLSVSQQLLDRTDLAIRDSDGNWRVWHPEIDSRQIIDLLRVKEHLVVVQQRDGTDEVTISTLSNTRMDTIASFSIPGEPWALVGMRDGLRRLVQSSPGETSMTRISVISGRLGREETLVIQPIPPRAIWQSLITVLFVGLVIFIVVVVKPGQSKPVTLPANTMVLPLGLRMTALLFDFAPGGILTMLVLERSPLDLIFHPLFASDPSQVMAFGMMLGLTMTHSLLGELWKATTLGKAILGARVITSEGGRPGVKQIVIRNMLKLVILLIPPLGLLMIRNPYLQGIPEMKSHTVVVIEKQEGEKH